MKSPTLELPGSRFTPGEACFVLDRDLTFTAVSAEYKELFELRGSIEGRAYAEVHGIGQSTATTRHLRAAQVTSEAVVFEDFYPSVSRWLQFRVRQLDSRLYGLVIDITERRLRESSRTDQALRAQQMLADCGMGLARLGLDGRCLDVNPRFCEITGWPKEYVLSQSLGHFFAPEFTLSDDISISHLVSGVRDRFSSERLLLNAAGTQLWVHLTVSLARGENRNPVFLIASLDDIAERKEAEESLSFALGAAQMGQWDYDAINDSTRRSDLFHRAFGLERPPEDWFFRDFVEHTHPDDRQRLESSFSRALEDGDDLNVDVRLSHPDSRWISLKGRAYLDRQGRVFRIGGLVKDISADKASEQDLQTAKLAAEDANREKSYFLANMSHEIRTPLGIIMGYLEVLKEKDLAEADRVRHLETLTRNGQNLARLIDDILDLSKVEAGFLEVEESACDIKGLIEEIRTLLVPKANAKNVSL